MKILLGVLLVALQLMGVFGLPKSKDGLGSVRYRKVHLCEDTPSVRSYSGYVSLSNTTNFFFWFFEARISPASAPLTLWLQGGPGMASTSQAVSGHNGPCIARPDSNSTGPNPWSWTGASNMLYIDQPIGTGFSYDVVTPGVLDLNTGAVDVLPSNASVSDATHRSGVFASQGMGMAANTTRQVAEQVVQVLDLWLNEFQEYRRDSINIWSQSYGGHYAPAIATLLQESFGPCQSEKSKSMTTIAPPIRVHSVGIINGVVDLDLQLPSYIPFAVNNTYGIQAYNETVAATLTAQLVAPGGCQDQGIACRQLQQQYDPDNLGQETPATLPCLGALASCQVGIVSGPYEASGRDVFDIGHVMPDPFPPPYGIGYLQQDWVREALGVPVQFMDTNPLVQQNFALTGDYQRSFLPDLAGLLNHGVRVALINGDRDYQCNWFGGESISLAISHVGQGLFAAAGYADMQTNASYVGGKVRQQGLLSFTRVFEAGHQVPYYQPETAYEIFARTLAGRDVATGQIPATDTYATGGTAPVVEVGSVPPSQPPVECYVEAAPLDQRCTDAQIAALRNGTATVQAGVVVKPAA